MGRQNPVQISAKKRGCAMSPRKSLLGLPTTTPTILLLLLVLLIAPTIIIATASATNKTEQGLSVGKVEAGESNEAAAEAKVSGYGIAQTLDFATEKTTTALPPKTTTTAAAAIENTQTTTASAVPTPPPPKTPIVDDGWPVVEEEVPLDAVIHSSSEADGGVAAGISNGHQNGMLLMAMLLDNKTADATKPALAAIFDFNPEDIQDLGGNEFYSVDPSNGTEDNEVDATNSRLTKNETGTVEEEASLWDLPAPNTDPLPLTMGTATNGQSLPGSALASMAPEDVANANREAEMDQGNIYKVKMRRRPEAREKQRDRHFSISSRMNVLGNEVETITQFQTLINMFDHWKWDETAIEGLVSETCGRDISTYLKSLRAGELWALKVADSSGKYRGMFMFGNIFWMGSKAFCLDVNYHNLADKRVKEGKRTLPNMQYVSSTMKLDLHSLLNKTKIIQVGQCMPKSCSSSDVEHILTTDPSFMRFNKQSEMDEDPEKDKGKTKNAIAMVNSRPVPGPYSLWTDRRFQILGGITVAICVIVVIATLVELRIDAEDEEYTKKSSTGGMQMNETPKNSHGDTQITVLSSEYNPKGYKDSLEITRESDLVGSGRKCPSEQNIILKFLLCFSLVSNGKAIMCLKTPSKDSLTSIHGIRLFSLLWTIMVHTYLQFFALSENRYGRKIAERSFGYQMIGNASFAVDTFFFLSGLLVALLFLRKGERASRQKSIFSFIGKGSWKAILMFIYRYLRLTPVYLVAIIANELSLKQTYNQSVFSPSIYDHVTCHHYWWRNILYINNWYPIQELCMIWSWYLANDMQFYLMAMFLLILSTRFMKTSVVISIVILFGSIILSAVISLKYDYMYKVADPFEAFDILYDKPWLRVGPYLMGMTGGVILAKCTKPPKVPQVINWALWIISVVVQFFLVFGTWDGVMSTRSTAIYVSVGHAAWGLSLLWMVMSCYWGLAPPINKLLSYRAFLPLSRLTYCTYLLHPMIMVITSFRMEAPFHLQHVLIVTAFLGNAVIAFIVALVASLLYEAPVIRILKLIFRK